MNILDNELDVVNIIRNWSAERITNLTECDNQASAVAILEEFYEWIDVEDGTEIDYLCIEKISKDSI